MTNNNTLGNMSPCVAPTLGEIIAIVGGKEARHGGSVVVNYGRNGYARLTPSSIYLGDDEFKAVEIEMCTRGRTGGISSDLRDKLRAGGLEIR